MFAFVFIIVAECKNYFTLSSQIAFTIFSRGIRNVHLQKYNLEPLCQSFSILLMKASLESNGALRCSTCRGSPTVNYVLSWPPNVSLDFLLGERINSYKFLLQFSCQLNLWSSSGIFNIQLAQSISKNELLSLHFGTSSNENAAEILTSLPKSPSTLLKWICHSRLPEKAFKDFSLNMRLCETCCRLVLLALFGLTFHDLIAEHEQIGKQLAPTPSP
eukprot:TRINITY_DN27796_c0_g1_i2.p1 TRINITY_DN27796_c0_g1~~TRINITY_DN27796_c0_g1_i2.p1  ORF type:complete len:217 (-),score=4.84 TRINITY_DN27796_c0_g1_i2:121-771(-)